MSKRKEILDLYGITADVFCINDSEYDWKIRIQDEVYAFGTDTDSCDALENIDKYTKILLQKIEEIQNAI